MLSLAGRYADGWLPSELVPPDEYTRGWPSCARRRCGGPRSRPHRRGRRRAHRRGRTDAAARELLQAKPIRFLALHASAATWRAHGATHPFGERYRGLVELLPHLLTRDEVNRAMAVIPDEIVAAQAIVAAGRPC